MYYIQTADRLTRTSVWLENMEGGIGRLREIILDDKLGLGDELERMMQHLVDTYRCEWTEVVRDPERRKLFRQFVNSEETDIGIEIISERGQNRPADWPKDGVNLQQIEPPPKEHLQTAASSKRRTEQTPPQWVKVGTVADFPPDGGAAIK